MKAPDDVLEIFLQPGEFYFGEDRTRISTLLGSCVALTLWHPRLHIGGMCHYILPTAGNSVHGKTFDGRYGDQAMQMFLREIALASTKPSDYQLKIFGGGSMLQQEAVGAPATVSQRNVDSARELAARHNFKIASEDLGGSQHRFVMFDLWSGDVWVRRGPGNARSRQRTRHAV